MAIPLRCVSVLFLTVLACETTAPAADTGLDTRDDDHDAGSLPTAEECEQYTDEPSCLGAGCTTWDTGTRWVYSDDACSPRDYPAPICWMNPTGESERSDAVTSYFRKRDDGSTEIVTISDRGDAIGWTRCVFYANSDCPCTEFDGP